MHNSEVKETDLMDESMTKRGSTRMSKSTDDSSSTRSVKLITKRRSVGIEIDDSWVKIIEFHVNKEKKIVLRQLMKEALPEGIVMGGKIQDMDQAVLVVKK